MTTLAITQFQPLLSAAAGSIAHGVEGTLRGKSLKLWHGWTPVFITSLAILAAAVLVVVGRRFVRWGWTQRRPASMAVYIYDAIVDAVYGFAYRLTTHHPGRTDGAADQRHAAGRRACRAPMR